MFNDAAGPCRSLCLCSRPPSDRTPLSQVLRLESVKTEPFHPAHPSPVGSFFFAPPTPDTVLSFSKAVLSSAGSSCLNSLASTPRMNLNSSVHLAASFPSIQLLGLEMLLHYLQGPEVVASAVKNKLVLSLGASEPHMI